MNGRKNQGLSHPFGQVGDCAAVKVPTCLWPEAEQNRICLHLSTMISSSLFRRINPSSAKVTLRLPRISNYLLAHSLSHSTVLTEMATSYAALQPLL